VTTIGLTTIDTTGVLQQAGTAYSSGASGFTLIRSRVRVTRVCLHVEHFVFRGFFLFFDVLVFPGFV